MRRKRFTIPKEYVGAAIILVLVALFVCFKVDRHYLVLNRPKVQPNFWGLTYSKEYAASLGLDWKEAYLAMINELGAKQVRLPVYWDDVSTAPDELDFSNYDWMLEQGARQNVTFILALGGRLPRWPECHYPSWLSNLSSDQRSVKELAYIQSAVQHFQPFKNISAWQIQNEYYVTWFGNCPKGVYNTLNQQISLVRSLDRRPVILTDSGEFSLWREVASQADIVGSTMYRVAWNKYIGYTYSPWPAWFYRWKALLNHLSSRDVIVAELQAEPWPPSFQDVRGLTRTQINTSFSLEQFATNAELARRTKFNAAYFWGAEWWYWLKLNGDSRYWDFASNLFRSSYVPR